MSDKVYFPYGMPIRSEWDFWSGENVSAKFLVELQPSKYIGHKLPSVVFHVTLKRLYLLGHDCPFDGRYPCISDEVLVELAPMPMLKCPRLGPTYEEFDKCNKAIQGFVEQFIRERMGDVLAFVFGDVYEPKAVKKWQPLPTKSQQNPTLNRG